MTDDANRGRGLDTDDNDLVRKRDAFVKRYFRRGEEFAARLVKDNDLFRHEANTLRAENAELRAQLASDDAIRDLLARVQGLRAERDELVSRAADAEATSSRFLEQQAGAEDDLSRLASVYVSIHQLHASLTLADVLRTFRDTLGQLVGAAAHAIYAPSEEDGVSVLVPIAHDAEDSPARNLPRVVPGSMHTPVTGTAAQVERAWLTRTSYIDGGDLAKCGPEKPAAVIPLVARGRHEHPLGAIVVLSILDQKRRFSNVDQDVFGMLAAHGGNAVAAALAFESFDALNAPSEERTLRTLLRHLRP